MLRIACALLILLGLLSGCLSVEGKRYIVVEEGALEHAGAQAAFLMCIELTARLVGQVVQGTPENLKSVIDYCRNEVSLQINLEYPIEQTPEEEADGL